MRSDLLSVNEGRRSHEASRKQVGSGERSPGEILTLVKRASTSASLCLFPPQNNFHITHFHLSTKVVQLSQLSQSTPSKFTSSFQSIRQFHCFRLASSSAFRFHQYNSSPSWFQLSFHSRSTRSSAQFSAQLYHFKRHPLLFTLPLDSLGSLLASTEHCCTWYCHAFAHIVPSSRLHSIIVVSQL